MGFDLQVKKNLEKIPRKELHIQLIVLASIQKRKFFLRRYRKSTSVTVPHQIFLLMIKKLLLISKKSIDFYSNLHSVYN